MAQKIILQPDEVWDYFVEHEYECANGMCEIASCPEYGITVYLSGGACGVGYISVEADDQEVYSKEIVDAEDAERTTQRVYDDYLTDKVIDILSCSGSGNSHMSQSQMDEISIREEELDNLVWDFVSGVLVGTPDIDFACMGESFADLKDHFLEYMYRKHGFDIYRPMILEDDDGSEFFEAYPYGCMTFDDEDNPLYKE